jgi:sortase A
MRGRPTRILSIALITASVVIFADVGLTLAWQEPVSSLYGSIQQGKAEDQLDELTAEFPTAADLRAVEGIESDPERAKILAQRFRRLVKKGKALGRVKIDRIDQDIVMVQGTDEASLRRGPGHYPDTKLPGVGSTAGIAGHRTTYLAPFRQINKIKRRDEIVLEMPYGELTYAVQKHRIVRPEQTEIVRPVGYDRIVLTACHPLYSAAERWAVFARLVRVSAPGG